LIDTTRERYDMWLLKRYGLPFLYWNVLLRGRASSPILTRTLVFITAGSTDW